MVDNYQLLGNAIVLQAARDYRVALRRQHMFPDDKESKSEIIKLRRFFNGKEIKIYTKLDGVELMKAIEQDLIDNNYEIRKEEEDMDT